VLRFAWWSMRGRWGRLVTLCLGLICISVCTTLLAGFTRLSTLTADRQVSRSWHATYDLLVRAPAALSPVERQLGIVDPSGPEQTYGGISLAQVATIAHIPHVAVAAPEAVVGWVPLQPYVPVTFTQPGLYRVTTSLAPLPRARFPMMPDQHTDEAEVRTTYMVLSLAAYMHAAGPSDAAGNIAVPLDATGTATVAASWPLSALLVGIDPAAEARLVGLRWQPADSHPTSVGELPLLMDTHPWTPLTATVTVERALHPQKAGESDWTMLWQQQFDAHDLLTLLAHELGDQSQRIDTAPLQGGGVARYARTGYTVLQSSSTGGTPPVLAVLSAGTDAQGPLVRLPLLPQATTPWVALGGSTGTFATFDPTTLPTLHDSASLSVPLGLYRPEPAGVEPDLFPQYSVVSWPPLLLTTVSAACALTGTRCISAVRVRIAGLGPFGPRSEALLQQVAADIEGRTGLHVDILAGASGRPLTVQAPWPFLCIGHSAVLPAGQLTSPPPQGNKSAESGCSLSAIWVQPHAAVTIAGGVNAANVLLLLAAAGVAALALIAAALLAASSRRADMQLLAQTGWSGGRILIESALEGGATAVLAALPAWVLTLLLNRLGAPVVAPGIVLGSLSAAALLYTSIVVGATRAAFANRSGRFRRARWIGKNSPWWWVMLRRSVGWRRGSATLVGVAAGGACGLVSLMALVRWGLDGILYTTLLGRQVQVSLSAIHIVAALLTCASATLTAGLTLLLVVRERRREFGMLLALGWTGRAIAAEIMREGVALGFLGGLSGGIVAAALFLGLYHVWPPLILTGGVLGAALLGAFLCAIGVGYPALFASRLLPVRVLSEE
jgi:putative ABC transport system permease protein